MLFVFESPEAEETFAKAPPHSTQSTKLPCSAPTPTCSPSTESWPNHGACRHSNRPHDGPCTTWAV